MFTLLGANIEKIWIMSNKNNYVKLVKRIEKKLKIETWINIGLKQVWSVS